MTRWRLICLSIVVVTASLAAVRPASAQLPPNVRWHTIESAHFRVTYEPRLESLARHAAASAERAHAALRVLVAQPPSGTIDIVLADNLDFTAGFATPFPSNRIVVFARPPIDLIELQYVQDWIELVVTHELAHIFHLDVAGAVGRAVRAVFGRLPWAWPVYPVIGTPRWGLEGLAVGIESGVAGHGRLHGSYHEMVVRTAVLASEFDDIHRLNSTSPVWPGEARVYIFGSLFMDYLARRYGPDVTARLVRATASAVLPPPLFFGNIARRTIGISFEQAYRDWRLELDQRYAALADRLRAEGLTQAEPLTEHGRIALFARYSPDGRRIVYGSNDGRAQPRTTVIDTETGTRLWSRVRNDVAPHAWTADGRLVTSDLQFADRFHIRSDLYDVGGGARRRLTREQRLQEVDVARDGRIVAVENRDGTNRLVLLDARAGNPRAITPFDADVHWSLPRWSPAADRIAASRWTNGGEFDVVVLDTLGTIIVGLTDGRGVNTGAAWSPDGRWLLFASDRTGISNLYAADVAGWGVDGAGGAGGAAQGPPRPRLRQVTNLLTGAFLPDISPDGRWIAFSAYHHDGFQIQRMPFEPAQWREPQPVVAAEPAGDRLDYPTPIPHAEHDATVRRAVAAADTTVSAPASYRALRHARPYYWVPVIEQHARDDFYGIATSGNDLVGRHAWSGSVALAPSSGRSIGSLAYVFNGLPSIPGLDVHPSLTLAVRREWDEIDRDTTPNGFRIDEREDVASLALGLTRVRWRAATGGSVAFENVRRARDLLQAPANLRLVDEADDLVGIRVAAFVSTFAFPAFAISRENGATFQLAVRHRWDRDVRDVQIGETLRRLDAGYREFTAWNAAYLALPLPGFARHVAAARFSALHRTGPGASMTGIGGAGAERFLPVRGFSTNARRGTRAWTASVEYRFPIALVSRSLAPLPVFVDRLAGNLFADAGHAWCSEVAFERFRSCVSTSPTDSRLLSAGGEIASFLSLWGFAVPLRLGLGVPVQPAGEQPRVHFTTGIGF